MKRESTFTDTIIYSSLQPGKWDLYHIDKLLPTNLTLDESLNYHPVYHPTGRYLVFTSERNGLAQLYCIDTENANQTPFRLTNNTHHEDQAAFSPNGELIYFVSTKDNGVADIYELPFNAPRTQQIATARNLTKGVHNNLHPDISPCGKWMVFSSNREHDAPLLLNPNVPKNYRVTDIFKMHLISGELTRLTDSADWDGSPVWSHTGQEIYFYSTRGEDKTPHIYSMNADGSEIKMILSKETSAVNPKLIPNGRLAFTVISGDQHTIASVTPGKMDIQEESPADRNYYGGFFHPKTSHCIAYGDGPKNATQPQFVAEPHFANQKPPGVGRFLLNRYQQPSLAHTELCCIRGFFPTYDATRKQILCVEEFNKVVLMDIDGNKKTLVYQHDKNFIGIHWSSDRTWFVAAMGEAFTNKKSDIWKISIDGVVKQNLTSKLSGHKMFPKISNNDQSIVFCNRDEDNSTDVYTINNDGNGLNLIRKNATLPAFSPDGQKIVYSSKPNYHLYLIDSTGNGEPEQLTNNRYADLHAEFSPDGLCVAFTSERGGLLEETPLLPIFSPQPYGDIYSVEISSKIVTRITESKWECSLPNWTRN